VPLTMLVRSLAQHISPMRLLDEFPTALSAEALYERRTGAREAVTLTFDAKRPPASRESQSLHCSLQPVVTPPMVSEATKRVVWKRTPPAAGSSSRRAPEGSSAAVGRVTPRNQDWSP